MPVRPISGRDPRGRPWVLAVRVAVLVLRAVLPGYGRRGGVRRGPVPATVTRFPVRLDRQVEALRSYHRRRVPRPGLYAAAAAATALFDASRAVADLALPPSERW